MKWRCVKGVSIVLLGYRLRCVERYAERDVDLVNTKANLMGSFVAINRFTIASKCISRLFILNVDKTNKRLSRVTGPIKEVSSKLFGI